MSLSVLVCRGCCCGTAAKHPDVDHEGQVETLRASLGPAGRLYTVDCLGPCSRSNVMVVRTGRKRRWFGGVLTDDQTSTLADWLTDGARTDPPPDLAALAFDPDNPDAS